MATVRPSDGKENEKDNIHLTAGFLGDELLRLVEEPLGGTNGKFQNIALTMSSPLKHWTKGTL